MAHYAFLDDDGTVTQVIVGRDENDLLYTWDENPLNWTPATLGD